MAREINKENYPGYFGVMSALKKATIVYCLIILLVAYFYGWFSEITLGVLFGDFSVIFMIWFYCSGLFYYLYSLEKKEEEDNNYNNKFNDKNGSDINEYTRLGYEHTKNYTEQERNNENYGKNNETKTDEKTGKDFVVIFRCSNPEFVIPSDFIPFNKVNNHTQNVT